jgi:hypothetical protein
MPAVAAADSRASRQRNQRLAASRENRFWGRGVLRLQEGLVGLRLVELEEDPQLLLARRLLVRRSTRSWIQLRCSGSMMCMYSMPTVRQ